MSAALALPRPSALICLVLGWAVIGFALHGVLSSSLATAPGIFRLLIGLNVVNDALVIPLFFAAAYLARRFLPRWALMPVQVGLIVSAVVTLYAFPLVGSYGKTVAAGPSRLPWNYAHNLGVVLAIVWAGCIVLGVRSWQRAHSNTP